MKYFVLNATFTKNLKITIEIKCFNVGEMRLFKEGLLVYTFSMEKPISALRFGPYGREESSLICVHGQVSTFVHN